MKGYSIREIAFDFVGLDGKINQSSLTKWVSELEKVVCLPSTYPVTDERSWHLEVLLTLQKSPVIQRTIEQIALLLGHRRLKSVVAQTIDYPVDAVFDREAQVAVLVAWLTPLRQNVGSCFATAPAILIQREQPKRFIQDLKELLGTGKLERRVEGVSYAVPVSPSSGKGELLEPILVGQGFFHPRLKKALDVIGLSFRGSAVPVWTNAASVIEQALREEMGYFEEGSGSKGSTSSPFDSASQRALTYYEERFKKSCDFYVALTSCSLLKAWEFTLASFSDVKSEFSKWNFYASLGWDHRSEGGIGACFYGLIETWFEEEKRGVEEARLRYETAHTWTEHARARAQRTGDEWDLANFRRKKGEFDLAQKEAQDLTDRANRLSSLYPVLVEGYQSLFSNHFQELYDADMQGSSISPYDDAKAGFRLYYKHRREDPSLWTAIDSPKAYSEALADFFLGTESFFLEKSELKGLEKRWSELITVCVHHVRSEHFLNSSMKRLASVYGLSRIEDPLKHLDRVERKPWAYFSGGTMSQLVPIYWGHGQKLKRRERHVESVLDLLLFLFESMKESPGQTVSLFIKDPKRSMLIESSTHAFLFHPGRRPFCQGWQSTGNTYTWVRDQVLIPHQQFAQKIRIDPLTLKAFIGDIGKKFSKGVAKELTKAFESALPPSSIRQLQKILVNRMKVDQALIDGLIYEFFPYVPANKLLVYLDRMEDKLIKESSGYFKGFFQKKKLVPLMGWPLSSKRVFEGISIAMQSLKEEGKSCAIDDQKIMQVMQKLGISWPAPLIFADPNWKEQTLGFVVNPSSEELELWRLDTLGLTGRRMVEWDLYLQSHAQPWALLSNPSQYQ